MYNYPYGDNQQINLNWIISEIIALHQRLDPDYTAPTFTQIYPFSETQQLNLDWILTELKALKELAPTPAPTETIDEVGQALIAGAYDSDTQYQKNDYIVQDGKVYRANAATTGTFDPAKWREVMLGDDLAIITRWADATNTYLNNLAASNVSNDSSVAGDTVKDALGTLNGALSDITATKRITTLSDLDTSVNHFIQFGASINVGGITFPEFSKGVLVTNGGTDATIYAIDVLTGSLFIADRLSGTWRHGRNITQEISNLNGAITNLEKYKMVGGAIRKTSDGWVFLNDTGHAPLNISGSPVVETDGHFLKINFNFTATKIITFICGCDETWSEFFEVGASVSDTYARLNIHNLPIMQGGMAIYDPNNTQTGTHTNGWLLNVVKGVTEIVNQGQGRAQWLTESLPFSSTNLAGGSDWMISAFCNTFACTPQSAGPTQMTVTMKNFDGTAIAGSDYPTDGSLRLFAHRTIPTNKLLWNDITANNLANIWFFGLFEVA